MKKLFTKLAEKLAKKLLPGADTLSKFAAKRIRERANAALLPRKEAAQKWSELAATVTAAARDLAEMARDGYIDETEEECLALMMQPAFEKLREVL